MDEHQQGIAPFSYDILDAEAEKISRLMLAVQQKCAESKGKDVSAELFEWAEALLKEGQREQAEFLYLHAINVYERNHGINFAFVFTSLREFAQRLLQPNTGSVTTLDFEVAKNAA